MAETQRGHWHPGFRDRLGWYLGLSAYWFATSYKWFILLLAVLPGQVAEIAPEGERAAYWGTVFAIGAAWAMIGPALFGYLSDRTQSRWGRRKPYIALGAALTVVALMVLAGADTLWALIAGYLLLQISDDVGTGPFGGLIPELVPEERRGRASGIMSLLQLSANIASAVAGMILGEVVLIYVGIAVVNAVCAGWSIWTLRGVADPPVDRGRLAAPSFAGFVRGWIEPWRTRDFVWVWLSRFLAAFALYLVQPYLRFYIEDMIRQPYRLFGFPVGDAERATIVIGLTISLFGALGSVLAALLADRVGRKRTIYVAGAIMCSVLVPFAFARDFTLIWVLAVWFGIGYGMRLGSEWALAADVMPQKEAAAKDMGVWVMSLTSVQIFAGAMGWAIAAGNAIHLGYGYTGAIILASLAILGATVVVRYVKGSA
jgi:MFS family permease